jgi:arsenite methyltransferase
VVSADHPDTPADVREDAIKHAVRDNYGALARGRDAMDEGRLDAVARAFGYTPEEFASLPSGANLGVSCGDPIATASLQPDEVVVASRSLR